MTRSTIAFAMLFAGAIVRAAQELRSAPSIAELFLGEGMEHTGAMALDAQNGQIDCLRSSLPGIEETHSFGKPHNGRDSEARRFLFAAAHHGTRKDATLGSFPGKFAWIAVVLFVLSMLIAFVG